MDSTLEVFKGLFDCEEEKFSLEKALEINPLMIPSFIQDIGLRAKQLRNFAKELNDISNGKTVATITETVQKGAEVLEARSAGQLNFSGFEIGLLVAANNLFDDLVEQKLHRSSSGLATSFTLGKIPDDQSFVCRR